MNSQVLMLNTKLTVTKIWKMDRNIFNNIYPTHASTTWLRIDGPPKHKAGIIVSIMKQRYLHRIRIIAIVILSVNALCTFPASGLNVRSDNMNSVPSFHQLHKINNGTSAMKYIDQYLQRQEEKIAANITKFYPNVFRRNTTIAAIHQHFDKIRECFKLAINKV